jgi:hypothetical protein
MTRNFSVPLSVVHALCLLTVASSAEAAGVSGAIFTTTINGSAVNANQYDSKCGVYLDGGPGPHAPAKAAGLPDGDYYFQVTDPNGSALLNTDPVSNRKFRVTGGVITAFIGLGGSPHPTGIDQDHGAQGAITIGLANGSCPNDFLNTPSVGGVYKVWVTPVSSFVGNPANVDNPCSGSCSHGFVHSQSKTDNFKVQPGSSATFCLTVQKQFSKDGVTLPGTFDGWPVMVVDFGGSQLGGLTASGSTACLLAPGTYTVTEFTTGPSPDPNCSVAPPDQSTTPQVFLNGNPLPSGSATMSFTWNTSLPANTTVLFVNALACITPPA